MWFDSRNGCCRGTEMLSVAVLVCVTDLFIEKNFSKKYLNASLLHQFDVVELLIWLPLGDWNAFCVWSSRYNTL